MNVQGIPKLGNLLLRLTTPLQKKHEKKFIEIVNGTIETGKPKILTQQQSKIYKKEHNYPEEFIYLKLKNPLLISSIIAFENELSVLNDNVSVHIVDLEWCKKNDIYLLTIEVDYP